MNSECWLIVDKVLKLYSCKYDYKPNIVTVSSKIRFYSSNYFVHLGLFAFKENWKCIAVKNKTT